MNARQAPAVSLLHASQANPVLSRLMSMQHEAQQRMQAIMPLIPASLQPHVHHGPLEDGNWSLLLSNSTTAAKIRQLLPDFETCLRSKGLAVKSIRLKVNRQK
ncbi:MAG: hypothetical protein PHH58_14215 [Rhodoferax sp.]|nr:hypothetical protein [Rhodoferax sp.]